MNGSRPEIIVGERANGDMGLLGSLAELGRAAKVYLSFDFEHVVGIFGKRGTGKSYLMGAIAEAIAWQKPEPTFSSITHRRGAVLFDLLNIYQWMASEDDRLHVRLFHVPGFAPPDAASKELKLRPQDIDAIDWAILFGINGIREPMGQCLSEAVTRFRKGSNFSLASLLNVINGLSGVYAPETIRALTQRITSYNALGIFDNEGMELATLCQERSLSIILFAGVPEDVRSLYVFLVLRHIYEARVIASQMEKAAFLGKTKLRQDLPPKMWLFIDEAQNFIPSTGSTFAVEMLVRYVREGRNFGLSMCFTTQQPSAIDKRILAQIDALFSFTLTVPGDIQTVSTHLKAAAPTGLKLAGRVLTLREAVRDLAVGQCIVSSIDCERTFFMGVRDRVSLHGGTEV